MGYLTKNKSFFLIAVLSAASCGQPLPSAQPRAIVDDDYQLSFARVDTADGDALYRFQLCRIQPEAEPQVCFNPFYSSDGEPALFAVLPSPDGLRTKGLAGKSLRYATATATAVALGAVAFVMVPKAMRLAFTKLFQLHKASKSGGSDEAIGHMVHKRFIKESTRAARKASKRGEKVSPLPEGTYEGMLEKQVEGFKIFKSKVAVFFGSLFIVDGAVEIWKVSYEGWKWVESSLKKSAWGQQRLDLANAYPFLEQSHGDPHTVAGVQPLLIALREHLQLVFSDDYLREFSSPATAAEGVDSTQ